MGSANEALLSGWPWLVTVSAMSPNKGGQIGVRLIILKNIPIVPVGSAVLV